MRRVALSQVQKLMHNLGIPRGFESNTINRKIRRGTFKVPYIRIGLTKYFKEEDLLKWLDEQEKYND